MPTKLHELKMMFLVAPLDDLYGSETPILSKCQVKENLMQMFNDYVEQMMGNGEFASVIVAGRTHQVPPTDGEGATDGEGDDSS